MNGVMDLELCDALHGGPTAKNARCFSAARTVVFVIQKKYVLVTC